MNGSSRSTPLAPGEASCRVGLALPFKLETAGQALPYGNTRILMLFLAFVFVQGGGVARAQVGDELERGAAQPNFDIQESVFHQWIFGAGTKIDSAEEHLDAQLMLTIADIDRACSLSTAQRDKLVLAGHGDRKRFMDRVAEVRRVYEQLRHEPGGANEVFQATRPVAAEFEFGLYGEGSFFAKTVKTTLTPEQASRYREAQEEKLKFRYRAKVTLILASLDARVGFTSDQHQRFTTLILEKTTLPHKPAGDYEPNVVLLQIAKLPEAKVRPIFDDSQWKKMDLIFQKARGTETFLRANGHLD